MKGCDASLLRHVLPEWPLSVVLELKILQTVVQQAG